VSWGCNPNPDGKRCLFFVYIPKGSYLLSNLCATSGFIYNKNFSFFTLRGKKHWARPLVRVESACRMLLAMGYNPTQMARDAYFLYIYPRAPICYRTCVLFRGLYIIKTALSSMASVVWCLRQLFVHLLKALARLLEYHIAGAYFLLFLWVLGSILLSNPFTYLRFIYNKNFSFFTLRGKKHWARTDMSIRVLSPGAATPTQMAIGAYFLLIYPTPPTCYRTCVLLRGLYIIKTSLPSPFGAKNTGLELIRI